MGAAMVGENFPGPPPPRIAGASRPVSDSVSVFILGRMTIASFVNNEQSVIRRKTPGVVLTSTSGGHNSCGVKVSWSTFRNVLPWSGCIIAVNRKLYRIITDCSHFKTQLSSRVFYFLSILGKRLFIFSTLKCFLNIPFFFMALKILPAV